MPDHISVKKLIALHYKIDYIIGLLSYAHAYFACPGCEAQVAREKEPNNARAVAVISDMHVFINQLIECEITFRRFFLPGFEFGFLFCYLAAWHDEEQNKRKHDPQATNTNKIRASFNKMNFYAFVACVSANHDVAVQNL